MSVQHLGTAGLNFAHTVGEKKNLFVVHGKFWTNDFCEISQSVPGNMKYTLKWKVPEATRSRSF